MEWIRICRDRVRAIFARDAVTDEIQEELQFHVERRAADLERDGWPKADAQREALRRFGRPAVIRDRGYDIRGGGLMESLIQDVRFAVRLLWKQRGYTAVALTTLALGIGATTAIFCVADAALIRPLPYDKPEQLVRVGLPSLSQPERIYAASLEDMDRWRSLRHLFSYIGTARSESKTLLSSPEPERIPVPRVTADYLTMYGKTPMMGRGFTEADERFDAAPVALIGYRYWQSQYHGDPGVLGQAIRFSNDGATIVGVLHDDASRVQAKIYLPMQVAPAGRRLRQYAGWARLRDGVTVAQAQRELDLFAARLERELPEYKGLGARVDSELAKAATSSATTVNILLGAVGFVLLIACVNVASLQLARGTVRHTEFAIRAAIGAGRGRLIRQLVSESLVLSLAGSALGVLLAWLVLDSLMANIPIFVSSEISVGLNARVLGATVALTTVCGVLFGLLPAFRSSRVDLTSVLGRGSRGGQTALSRAAGGVLVAVEVAAAILLTIGATLMITSFRHVNELQLGFDANRFVTLEVAPVDDRPEVFGPYYAGLLERIRALPGVESAGATNNLPLGGSNSLAVVSVASGQAGVVTQDVTPGYFETLGIPLRAGRFPSGADFSDTSWIVLSDRSVAQLFPSRAPIGQQVKYAGIWRQVIGVVGDVSSNGFDRPLDAGQVYISPVPGPLSPPPNAQVRGKPLTIVVRTASGSGAALSAALRDAAKAIGPAVIVRRVRQGREWWSDNVVKPRQRTVLLGILGGLGLLLALVGVFGVTSFSVSRRTGEIGVRLAFGASPGQAVATMVKDAAVPIGIGIAIGLAGAFFLTKLIATFLFQTAPRDPVSFAAAALALAVCGTLAAWIPARRAARVNPVIALRGD